MSVTTTMLHSRGTGILDTVTPAELSGAVDRAYASLPETEQAKLDALAAQLVAGINKRRTSGAQFGPAAALELLAAIGRIA